MLAWICCRCKISNHALLALDIINLFFYVHVKDWMLFAICILIYEIICSQVLVLPPFQRMGLCAEMLQTFYNDAYRRKEVLDITGKDRQFMCCELYCRNHWVELFCNFHSATCTYRCFYNIFWFLKKWFIVLQTRYTEFLSYFTQNYSYCWFIFVAYVISVYKHVCQCITCTCVSFATKITCTCIQSTYF